MPSNEREIIRSGDTRKSNGQPSHALYFFARNAGPLMRGDSVGERAEIRTPLEKNDGNLSYMLFLA